MEMSFEKVAVLENYFKGTCGSFSYKDETEIYACGVKYYRYRLSAAIGGKLPEDIEGKVNETSYLLSLAKARGEEDKYPHHETLIHELMPCAYTAVISTPYITALTASVNGEALARELFGETFLWINGCEQGIPTATKLKKALGRTPCDTVFVEGCGVVISADTAEDVAEKLEKITAAVKTVVLEPETADAAFDFDRAALLAPAVRMLTGDRECKNNDVRSIAVFDCDPLIAKAVSSAQAFASVNFPLTGRQVANCGEKYLFVKGAEDIEEQYGLLENAINGYISENGTAPSVIGVEGLGAFACAATKADADRTMTVFKRALLGAYYASGLGDVKAMSESEVKVASAFAEDRKSKISCPTKRISQKIMIVTGGAQGFGEGIADDLLANGANVAIADLNIDLASSKAAAFCEKYGKGCSIALKTDVSDEESVKDMVYRTVLAYGGLDCMVSNAGIARSGNLEQMTKDVLELHTKINYTGFFLCSKYASRIMKIQYRFCKGYHADIVQVNSKSGLVGSNKNFAYAGSKFGGIGLTQSFALELVDYNVKVNSVCPGNYFDGPLWSDPEKGLFKQYLLSGKVPGAENMDDVRKFYESKIPMKAGCFPIDVSRAIMYCIEQLYETGQAIPVTGGQVMLS